MPKQSMRLPPARALAARHCESLPYHPVIPFHVGQEQLSNWFSAERSPARALLGYAQSRPVNRGSPDRHLTARGSFPTPSDLPCDKIADRATGTQGARRGSPPSAHSALRRPLCAPSRRGLEASLPLDPSIETSGRLFNLTLFNKSGLISRCVSSIKTDKIAKTRRRKAQKLLQIPESLLIGSSGRWGKG